MNTVKLDSSLFEEEDVQFQQIEGVIFSRRQNQESLDKIRDFKLDDQDVLCATYPKAGMFMKCNEKHEAVSCWCEPTCQFLKLHGDSTKCYVCAVIYLLNGEVPNLE